MITYKYNDKRNSPDLTQIHTDVGTSTMSDKSISYCTWHEDFSLLLVVFETELSDESKIELDSVVERICE